MTSFGAVHQNNKRATLLVMATTLLLATVPGCSTVSESFSESSASGFSKSISSPFKWSSGSSSESSQDVKESYRSDVRLFAEISSHSNSGVDDVTRGLTVIGEKYGISNWEADMTTFTGFGEGLAKAKTAQEKVDTYKKWLSRGDLIKSASIQKAYENGL